MDQPTNDNQLSLQVGAIDVNGILRDLMDASKVALGPDMAPLPSAEALSLLAILLVVIEDRMPEHLQRQDKRVAEAKALRDVVMGVRQ